MKVRAWYHAEAVPVGCVRQTQTTSSAQANAVLATFYLLLEILLEMLLKCRVDACAVGPMHNCWIAG